MTRVQHKLRQIFFHKLSGAILWICIWPFVSLLFHSHPHYPAVLRPLVVFARSSNAPKGKYWSYSYLEEYLFPAAGFWLVLIGIIVCFPSKQGYEEEGYPKSTS